MGGSTRTHSSRSSRLPDLVDRDDDAEHCASARLRLRGLPSASTSACSPVPHWWAAQGLALRRPSGFQHARARAGRHVRRSAPSSSFLFRRECLPARRSRPRTDASARRVRLGVQPLRIRRGQDTPCSIEPAGAPPTG